MRPWLIATALVAALAAPAAPALAHTSTDAPSSPSTTEWTPLTATADAWPARATIRWTTNEPTLMGPWRAAMAEISAATGLHFAPARAADPIGDLRIRFRDHADTPRFCRAAHWAYARLNAWTGHRRYDAVGIVVDRTVVPELPYGIARTLALHELGHAVGLGHVEDPASVMFPYVTRPKQLAAGDLAGLHALYPIR